MKSKLRHFLYKTAKSLYKHSLAANLASTPSCTLSNRIGQSIVTLFIFRVSLVTIIFSIKTFRLKIIPFDYLLHFMNTHSNQYNQYLSGQILILGIFVLIVKRILSNPNQISWSLYNGIWVLNLKNYWSCMKSIQECVSIQEQELQNLINKYHNAFIPVQFVKPYLVLKARFKVWFRMDHINLDQFLAYPLPDDFQFDFPLRLRIKMTQILIVAEIACCFTQIGVCKLQY